MEKSVIWA